MDQEADRDGPGMAAGEQPVARAPCSDTRTVWLPDEWAVYIANGDDPESPDWPIELCDEELRRLRLEGFDVVTCTDRTRELGEYRGIAGTMRAYEALRTGGDDTVVRRVTLVQEHLRLPAGESTRQVLLDVKLDLTRTESQPLERLVARAWRAGHGTRRRVALACGHVGDSGLERAWAHIDIDPTARPLPRCAWSHGAAVQEDRREELHRPSRAEAARRRHCRDRAARGVPGRGVLRRRGPGALRPVRPPQAHDRP